MAVPEIKVGWLGWFSWSKKIYSEVKLGQFLSFNIAVFEQILFEEF